MHERDEFREVVASWMTVHFSFIGHQGKIRKKFETVYLHEISRLLLYLRQRVLRLNVSVSFRIRLVISLWRARNFDRIWTFDDKTMDDSREKRINISFPIDDISFQRFRRKTRYRKDRRYIW